jgi:protein gp37
MTDDQASCVQLSAGCTGCGSLILGWKMGQIAKGSNDRVQAGRGVKIGAATREYIYLPEKFEHPLPIFVHMRSIGSRV